MRRTLLATAATLALAGGASAETFRFAFQGDVTTLDPHGLNETFTLGFQGNVYEGLTKRDENLEIVPGLATAWEMVEPNRWRFELREGVTFHNGNPFTAEDVVFSYERALKEGSDMKTKVAGVTEVIAVDDHTVEFVTETPNPILNAEFDTWFIMDKEWSEANGATEPTNVAEPQSFFAHSNANGTGPFRVTTREADVRTVAVPYEGWWGEAEHDLTEVIFTPITNDSTRVAALLSGELDMAYPIPLQDLPRVASTAGTQALTGPELRTIFLGFDQARDELLHSNVTGENPFHDRRVREAFYRAVDIEAIASKIMRGTATPSAALLAPGINGFPEALTRYEHDPERAKQLLEEAGYGDGFSVGMNCPNDRYVNDEAICQAVVGMLARIGVDVNLMAEPKSVYFGKVLAQGGYDTSFYLLGWTPSSFDSYNVLYNLAHCREGNAGLFNLGGYCNEEVDGLTAQVLTETDPAKRQDLIAEAWRIVHDEVGYLPLHQQGLAWGVREGIDVTQRADNQFVWNWVKMGG